MGKSFVRTALHKLGYRIDKLTYGHGDFDPSRCIISRCELDGVQYRWFVENPSDSIQSYHAKGEIYEKEELEEIRGRIGNIKTFVDIGANVGNHSIYALLGMRAQKVIAFEPARKQHDILAVNIALNDLRHRINVHKLALSDCRGHTWIGAPWEHNLGAARLNYSGYGEYVPVCRGDEFIANEDVTCIKIDVEGHEMKVLAGLEQTIIEKRPHLFVEVENTNINAFRDFMEIRGYLNIWEFRRYSQSINFLLQPK